MNPRRDGDDLTSTEYVVAGMTCSHCVDAVSAEVRTVAGVRDVHVELDGGHLTVVSDEPLDFDVVSAAVAEAGYTLGSR